MLVTGIFLGVSAFLEYPREIGRWHLAAAREKWRDAEYGVIQGDLSHVADNRQQAFAKLEDALKWSPEERSFIVQRAKWKLDAGQYEEALRDCNRLLEKFGDGVELLQLRERTHHLMGNHAEAVADAQRVNNLSKTSGIPPRADALNGLAYAKAIGKIDLDSALNDINESLRSETNAASLDTRGFIYYQMGKSDRALQDLEVAVREADKWLRFHRPKEDMKRRVTPDIREFEIKLRKDQQPIAVILYHRALAHEKLGHIAAAAADRQRVRELIGRDGDEKQF